MEVPREKDAHGLDIHCSNVPGILSTDATNLLFKKRGNLANENLFRYARTPDKVVSQLVGDVLVCCASIHVNITFVIMFVKFLCGPPLTTC